MIGDGEAGFSSHRPNEITAEHERAGLGSDGPGHACVADPPYLRQAESETFDPLARRCARRLVGTEPQFEPLAFGHWQWSINVRRIVHISHPVPLNSWPLSMACRRMVGKEIRHGCAWLYGSG
ncbi:hypothetical protein SBV1_3200008 [Verrucomicrobia bacterium]|nr:hypothetical protein SBV1_3200008 [Verrucomicrobiota bacterium]